MEWIILIFYYSSEALAVGLAVLFGCFVRRCSERFVLLSHVISRFANHLRSPRSHDSEYFAVISHHTYCALMGSASLLVFRPSRFIAMKTTVRALPALVKLNAAGICAHFHLIVFIRIWLRLYYSAHCPQHICNVYALETIQSSISTMIAFQFQQNALCHGANNGMHKMKQMIPWRGGLMHTKAGVRRCGDEDDWSTVAFFRLVYVLFANMSTILANAVR